MKRRTKYVALDVHQATTVASVRAESGRVIARSVLPAEGVALTEFVRGMRGAVHVAFEEGTQAQWLHDLLTPLVHRVVVCDRRGPPHAQLLFVWAPESLLFNCLRGREAYAVPIAERPAAFQPTYQYYCATPLRSLNPSNEPSIHRRVMK
jgi:hypothetical protein